MKDIGFSGDQLLAMYDRVAGAEDAIPRLRRFVLDLAVRGKLVAQDAADEPASELLKRIQAEKERLVKAGEIKKPRAALGLQSHDLPFKLPRGWAWTQVAALGFISPRNSSNDDDAASFVPMPLIAAEYGVPHEQEERRWGEIKKGYTHFADGDVGLAKITPCFENGKSTVFCSLTGGIGAGTTELHIVRPILVLADYIVLFFKSPHFIETGIPKMTGTAGQKRVPTEYFTSSPFPLPPLAEQQRIVAKVAELMGLLDQLEQTRARAEGVRARLTTVTWARLTTDAADDHQSARHTDFALKTLPALTTTPTQIKTLRQTILNLAVRGKLVEQDPNDEPASVLLGRIEAEKARLVKAGELRSSKTSSVQMVAPEYSLPTSWRWAALGKVFVYDAGDKRNPNELSPDLWLLELEDVEKDTGRIIEKLPVSSRESRSTKSQFRAGDILYGKLRPYLNKVVVADRAGYSTTEIVAIRPYIPLCPEYCALALRRPDFVEYVTRLGQGTKMPRLRTEDARVAPFPLPPLAEQHRIVAKVDALMALCDQLETALNTTATTKQRLLETLIRRALSPDVQMPEAAE
jgi:type I restriction enzyme, S subunit